MRGEDGNIDDMKGTSKRLVMITLEGRVIPGGERRKMGKVTIGIVIVRSITRKGLVEETLRFQMKMGDDPNDPREETEEKDHARGLHKVEGT